jgi:hypothetical protein
METLDFCRFGTLGIDSEEVKTVKTVETVTRVDENDGEGSSDGEMGGRVDHAAVRHCRACPCAQPSPAR